MEIAGVTITHPERVVFPQLGITKAMLAEYFVAVAPLMLPHIVDRPLSLVRCPRGEGTPCFYQKHWTTKLPSGLGVVDIRDDNDAPGPYVFVRDARGLVALVQYGVLELHAWGARADNVNAPDRIVFDLDPAPDVAWSAVMATARRVRRLLATCGLESWLKTSGGKGLHVVVPVARRVSWNDVRDFSRLVSAQLVKANPDGLVDVATKAARPGRIYIDYLRNARGATAVAPWSSRARNGATVSVPVKWKDAGALSSGNALSVSAARQLINRLRSDPWADMLKCTQRLSVAAMRSLMRP